MKNWAGNYEYQAAAIAQPESLDELQTLVKRSERLKVLGSRHSFNHIADTTVTHVMLGKLPRVLAIDADKRQVKVNGDILYGELSDALHDAGFALHNLASLPHISVAGACATATHGSGVGNGSLSTAVVALTFVSGNGDLVTLTRDDDDFYGAVVHLGAMGAITTLTLAIEPTYQMRQWIYKGLPFTDLETSFEAVMASAYSISFFTDWDPALGSRIWVKERVDDLEQPEPPQALFGAQRVDPAQYPVEPSITPLHGVVGAWHNRLPHFRMGYTPSVGDELQSEYFIPREHAVAAIHAVQALREHVAPVLFVTEIRAVAADQLWMSPCYEQDSVTIHFTLKPDWPGVRKVLPLVEAALAPFGARPHWGKLFEFSAETLHAAYPQLATFQRLIKQHDPQGKFRNAFIDTYIM